MNDGPTEFFDLPPSKAACYVPIDYAGRLDKMATMTTKRVFGYVRLSKEDEASTSPARQRTKIKRLCEDRGWELLDVYEDIDVSANAAKRPGFDRMMERLSECDAIVFWRLDRLARSVSNFSKLLDTAQAAKVDLVSTDQPIDTSSAMGRAFVQITAVFAELEWGTTSERSRQMIAYKREHDEPLGRVPFGWRREGKHFETDPKQQAVLKDAAKRYVRGETLSAIAKDHGMNQGPLRNMLASERVQDALPDQLAGQLAMALRERRGVRAPTSKRSLLGGMPKCGVCGGNMKRAATRAGRTKGGPWSSYRCPERGHTGISEPWLNQHVSEQVVAMVDTGRLVETIRKRRKTGRTRKASEVEARMQLLDEMLVEGKVTKARYEKMNAQLVERLSTAIQEERSNGIDLPEELAANLGESWGELALSARRRIIEAVVERIEVAPTKQKGGQLNPRRVSITWR